MRKLIAMFLILFAGAVMLQAAVINEGKYYQTSSTAGACDGCYLEITSLTPNILELKNSLGWIGYIYYDQQKDAYSGFFELNLKEALSDDDWTNEVFLMTVKNSGGIITIDAVSTDHMFISTYRK